MEKVAKRIDEFTPDVVWKDPDNGDMWLYIRNGIEDYHVYAKYPKIVEFENKRFYKMSFNTATGTIAYREAKGRSYDLRYSVTKERCYT